MNKMRRQELRELIDEVGSIQDKDDISDIINTLENIKYDEEYYYDNIPENLQYSQRAYDAEEAIDNMERALGLLEDAINTQMDEKMKDCITQAIDYINAARQ